MIELLRESILPVNLPFTILLGVIGAYWIIGLLGLVDMEALDGAGGVEADGIDLEGGDGGDGGEDAGDGSGGGFMNALLTIVGASDAPLIFVISLFSVFLWALNVGGNHYFNPDFDGGRATLLLIPVVIGAFVITRLLIVPLRPVMKLIRTPEVPVQIIGSSGVVRSSTLDSEFGEVEIESSERSLILRARISNDATALKKGDPILVVSKEEDSDTYIVRSL
jgi:hypothetical protein